MNKQKRYEQITIKLLTTDTALQKAALRKKLFLCHSMTCLIRHSEMMTENNPVVTTIPLIKLFNCNLVLSNPANTPESPPTNYLPHKAKPRINSSTD